MCTLIVKEMQLLGIKYYATMRLCPLAHFYTEYSLDKSSISILGMSGCVI